jgi:hypothetical protein
MANDLRPWRDSPFAVGRRYRVRRDFDSLRDRFTTGEILIYQRDAWSRYDEITGYVFSQPHAPGLRVWDLPDGEDLEIWRERFEELPGDVADT